MYNSMAVSGSPETVHSFIKEVYMSMVIGKGRASIKCNMSKVVASFLFFFFISFLVKVVV